jgi:nitrogen fixation protein FixH
MTARLRWTIIIVGLLGSNMIAMAVLAGSAQSSRAQVIPDYYDRALDHDRVLAAAARSSELDWRVEVELSREAIVVAVHDARGAPINGRVSITGYPRAHAVRTFEVELHGLGSGRYRAARINDRGWHDLVIAIDTPEARDTQRISAEAP